MGIGGHKHHFDEHRIEKEMKNIGDAVRVAMFSLPFATETDASVDLD